MREEIQTEILTGGESPVLPGGLSIRPITFASLLLLRKLKNPLARALENGGAVNADNMEALVELLWVQCAPWDEVRRLVSAYREDRAVIDAAILDFAVGFTPEAMTRCLQELARHQQQVQSVAAEVLPDGKSAKSKN